MVIALEKLCNFCGEKLRLLRTTPVARRVRFYPQASGFRSDLLCSAPPRGGIQPIFSRVPSRVYSALCHCSGRGETWSRVGGRYFGLSGSVVSGCAGPLSGAFGVVMQSGVGKLPETTVVVHHTGKKGPITVSACGLRTGDCGDGLGSGGQS